MRHSLFIIAFAGATAACASSGATPRSRCALDAADSVYAKGGPVYRDCAVEHRATPIDRSAHPDFNPLPPSHGGQSCYSAEIEFVVDTAGMPETKTAKIVRSNNADFAAAALTVIGRWRYRPATIQGVPVRQIVREKQGMALVAVAAPMGQPPREPSPGQFPIC